MCDLNDEVVDIRMNLHISGGLVRIIKSLVYDSTDGWMREHNCHSCTAELYLLPESVKKQ